MTDFFANRDGIGVHQRRKFFELRNQYTLTNEQGSEAGTVEQQRQSAIAWLTRLVSSLDVVLPTTLRVADASGSEVLVLHKPWFRWRITVSEPTGRVLGSIRRVIRIGKPVYQLADPSDSPIGEIRAQDWRSRNFEVQDAGGSAIGRVTKQWRGLLTEALTDADSYAVTFEPRSTPDQRAMTFAGALSVDLIQKQKDAGGGLSNLIPS